MKKQMDTHTSGQSQTIVPSHLAENYLSSLYKLHEQGEKSTPGRLADYIRSLPRAEGLGTSLPSVLAMIRRMAREGLVVTDANKEIELTSNGLKLAQSIVRRHRLAECMVVTILELDWHLACVEGHRLEHAISDSLAEHIAEKLNFPSTNPFGWPIPGNGKARESGEYLRLNQASEDSLYIVDRVPEESPDLLKFLSENGVVPEAELTVIETGAYRGVLTFRTKISESAVDYQTAARIWIRHS
ncbi:metal-dependent transcriptional regulator [SAR202 cluster bacterium AD-802-E10_MRT_200m]|nr:metal-dependent transcriptional regulator [SAR202 cluster bacterium AD-802-E10_MRT_200m]